MDLYRGRLSAAKVLRLISWLPDDGAFAASLRGGHEFMGWGADRVLRAEHWDLASRLGFGKKAPQYPRPKQSGRR